MNTLEKEFAPYQESLELKELGFDEPCFGKYLSNLQSDWKKFELILEMGMNEEFEDNRNIYLLEEACSAPTFSQAFRWFREKHKLNAISPTLLMYTTDWAFRIIDLNRMEDVIGLEKSNSYEEAELACLKKLIEIVKNKQNEKHTHTTNR